MQIPDKATIRRVLDDFHPLIRTAVLRAWDDWRNSDFEGRWRHSRGRANFVWEQIIYHFTSALPEICDVHIFDKNHTTMVIVRGQVLFRFKKANEKGLSSNIPTQLALDFHDHHHDLFEFPDVERVEVVYILNRPETQIDNICVVARSGKKIVWEYSILNSDESLLPLPLPKPAVEHGPARTGASIVTLKTDIVDHKNGRD